MTSNIFKKSVVIGAGSYGTALALHWHKKQKPITLLTRSHEKATLLEKEQENKKSLKGISLDGLFITSDINSCHHANIIVLAIPSQSYKIFIPILEKIIDEKPIIVMASKGIDVESGLFLKDIIKKYLKNPVAVWSGPQFAHEVANLLPSAVTLGSKNKKISQEIINQLSTDVLRIYPTSDVMSVQLAGALKNVIAIACGIARGMNLGENAIAALMTRGLAEIRRLGIKMGGDIETFLGLCGMGDLVLTCSSLQSRNTQLGVELTKNDSQSILSSVHPLAEGIYTVKAAYTLSLQYDTYMPITQSIYRLLYENDTMENVINALLSKKTQEEKH